MSMPGGQNWQVLLADLSLILFLSTATALAGERSGAVAPLKQTIAPPAPHLVSGDPAAVYRASLDAPPFADWLAMQQRDPRERLTITGSYTPATQEQAWAAAGAMARSAQAQGHASRIVLRPAGHYTVAAVFSFDADPEEAGAAHGLQLAAAPHAAALNMAQPLQALRD
ncbi:hypothetical protein HME9302_00344 [Alteripontixanthobacter maritimus]|uniref:Uncharacterized protein n=1 Tax=Alteripontixanthobacter maritimus TaxID=2161824 RepID=A0A369Q8B1_9SPHN|nr:hypothetical protein [Alteripontixanthobacter maritimus]RDC59159.1 hypothetical protein HME9302_00344 [Alteripontixanthobacter maritimus]